VPFFLNSFDCLLNGLNPHFSITIMGLPGIQRNTLPLDAQGLPADSELSYN
jgi:hypothetical protein